VFHAVVSPFELFFSMIPFLQPDRKCFPQQKGERAPPHNPANLSPKYGFKKGGERVTSHETGAENFSEITDAEAEQMGFPF